MQLSVVFYKEYATIRDTEPCLTADRLKGSADMNLKKGASPLNRTDQSGWENTFDPSKNLSPRQRDAARDLIYLVSCAVNKTKPDAAACLAMDLSEVYRLAKAHSLTAAASFALEQVTELPHSFDQAKKKAIRKLALFDIERAVILQNFDTSGIWYLPLKGILLRNDYPKAAMREMSDNDILVDPERMKQVRDIMETLGYTCEDYGHFNHDVYSKPPTLEFEIHHALFDKDDTLPFSAYYENIADRLVFDGYQGKMTDEDFYLYMLCHTYRHYIYAGCGLRSLLDIYVFLCAHEGLDRDYLRAELEKVHLTSFEEEMQTLSKKVFSGALLSEREQRELDRFIFSGSYGNHQSAEYNKLARKLGYNDSRQAKRDYLRKRVFLSGDRLRKRYPIVSKHKALYPFVMIYRPIRGMLRHPKKIIREYRNVIRFKQ